MIEKRTPQTSGIVAEPIEAIHGVCQYLKVYWRARNSPKAQMVPRWVWGSQRSRLSWSFVRSSGAGDVPTDAPTVRRFGRKR